MPEKYTVTKDVKGNWVVGSFGVQGVVAEVSRHPTKRAAVEEAKRLNALCDDLEMCDPPDLPEGDSDDDDAD